MYPWASEPPLPSCLPPQSVEERLGGPLGMLRCWGRCLLVAGAKSYTHMVIALERYYGPLKNAVDAAGEEVGAGCRCEVQVVRPAGGLRVPEAAPALCTRAQQPERNPSIFAAQPCDAYTCRTPCRARRRWWMWPARCGAARRSAPPWRLTAS